MYTQTGTHIIADFTWRPKAVRYDFDTRRVEVEILMRVTWSCRKKHYWHSRTFGFELPADAGSLSTDEVMGFILNLPAFAGSKKQP